MKNGKERESKQKVKGVTARQSFKEFSEPRETSAFALHNAPTDLG